MKMKMKEEKDAKSMLKFECLNNEMERWIDEWMRKSKFCWVVTFYNDVKLFYKRAFCLYLESEKYRD